MALLSIFKKKVLGVDLGSLRIKIVEGIKTDHYFEITNFGVIPIINFNEIINYSYILEDNLSLILRDFLKAINSKATNVFLTIPAPYIFSTNFIIPYVPEKELPNVIHFESQKQVPLNLEDIILEYRYLPLEKEGNVNQWLVYIAGVHRSYLEKIKSVLESVKLKLIKTKSEYFNFEPLFSNKSGSYVIVDLGHSYSLICLINNGKVVYGNKLSLKGFDFLENIKNVTGYSDEEIFDFVSKKGFQFLPEEKDLEMIVSNFSSKVINLVTSEISKIENSFLLQVNKVYWTGGLVLLPGFREYIFGQLSNYQHGILLPTEISGGKMFKELNDYQTIFIHALGCIF